ncbi:hypothetical protein DPMN_057886 [Dreissena polymorpha]|uniref:Uncharacterized protein n=1 Tax=Dreissena polymorpha TaxID=45954 RepID=A0A9D4C100_DREPO|nr:hypothetical protein DPMN_057886 [Dreissena polymorpha]
MEEDACLFCKKAVRLLQHGITCDVCDRWQHRTCNTDYTELSTRARLTLSGACPRRNSSRGIIGPGVTKDLKLMSDDDFFLLYSYASNDNEVGLQTTYERRKAVHALMRKLMSIPFLPVIHVPLAFSSVRVADYKCSFYVLVPLLRREAAYLQVQAQLVPELAKLLVKMHISLNQQLGQLWDEYD